MVPGHHGTGWPGSGAERRSLYLSMFAAPEAGGVAVGVIYRAVNWEGVMVRKLIGAAVLLVLMASLSGCALFTCTAPPVC